MSLLMCLLPEPLRGPRGWPHTQLTRMLLSFLLLPSYKLTWTMRPRPQCRLLNSPETRCSWLARVALGVMEEEEEHIPPDADVTMEEFCDREELDQQKAWSHRAPQGCSRSSRKL